MDRLQAQVLEISKTVAAMDMRESAHVVVLLELRRKLAEKFATRMVSIDAIEGALANMNFEISDKYVADKAWLDEVLENMATGLVNLYDALANQMNSPELVFIRMAKEFSITCKS